MLTGGEGIVLGAGVSWWLCMCVCFSQVSVTVLPSLINLPDEEEAVINIKAVAAGLFGLFFFILM